jgi:hypothetical protein
MEPFKFLVHQIDMGNPLLSGVPMKAKAKPRTDAVPMIGAMRLDLALDLDHELVRLAGVIPWYALAEEFGPLYCADNGRPAVPIRLMAGLHYLKHLKAWTLRKIGIGLLSKTRPLPPPATEP